MTTPQEGGLPPARAAAPQTVPCASGCGRSLIAPADAGSRVILCRSCWTTWLHTVMKLIRVVKEEV